MGHKSRSRMSPSPPMPTPPTPPQQQQSPSPSPSPSPPRPSPLDASLHLALRYFKCFESEDALHRRRTVLRDLDLLVRQWIQSVSLSRGMHYASVDKLAGRVLTYGSYLLGTSHEGADIDALCVAPAHVTRQEYFTSFYSLLSYQNEVRELRAIEDCFVPVLKMKYDGIEIDMTFARVNKPELPTGEMDALVADGDIAAMDIKCIRSLNGYRGAQLILTLVPDRDVFQATLRAVKLWAKSQGLYSNILGYLGGFSWAVLVAKTCVQFPEERSAAHMLFKFFSLFSNWEWPKPVSLVEYRGQPPSSPQNAPFSQSANPTASGYAQHSIHMLSWDPEKNLNERHQPMPVLTPTYPFQNSTFNVTVNTRNVITDKLRQARDTVARILAAEHHHASTSASAEKAASNSRSSISDVGGGGDANDEEAAMRNNPWRRIFDNSHLFHEYEHFVIVIASANTKNHLHWFGLIESKIRHFVASLEKDKDRPDHSICIARIWPKPYMREAQMGGVQRTNQLWFVGLDILLKDFLASAPGEFAHYMRVVVRGALAQFQHSLKTQASKFFTADMDFGAHFVQRADLKKQLSEKDILEIVGNQYLTKAGDPPPSPPPPGPGSGQPGPGSSAGCRGASSSSSTAADGHKSGKKSQGGANHHGSGENNRGLSCCDGDVFSDCPPGPGGDCCGAMVGPPLTPTPKAATPKRSISMSSDQFPPPALIQARLNHQGERVPFSPLSTPPPLFDYSVPPPPSPGSAGGNNKGVRGGPGLRAGINRPPPLAVTATQR